MSERESVLNDRIRAWLGTAMMMTASCFAVLIFCDRMRMNFLPLPATWYSSRHVHLVLCGGMFLAAAVLLKSPLSGLDVRNGRPVFLRCRLLTRENCKLCDDALATLLHFQDALPTIEVVDIDNDAQLIRQFGESVPVVELDGKVRFRGAVVPALLMRMIVAAEVRAKYAAEQDSDSDVFDSGVLARREDEQQT